MHTIELRAMAEMLETGDMITRETACELEAGDASRREAIRGIEASYRAGRRRRERRREITNEARRR